MIYVINFADKRFAQQQHDNTLSAYKKGKADKVIEYTLKILMKSSLKLILGSFHLWIEDMDCGFGSLILFLRH